LIEGTDRRHTPVAAVAHSPAEGKVPRANSVAAALPAWSRLSKTLRRCFCFLAHRAPRWVLSAF